MKRLMKRSLLWYGNDTQVEKKVEEKIAVMLPLLNEKQRRIYLASEAMAIGRAALLK